MEKKLLEVEGQLEIQLSIPIKFKVIDNGEHDPENPFANEDGWVIDCEYGVDDCLGTAYPYTQINKHNQKYDHLLKYLQAEGFSIDEICVEDNLISKYKIKQHE